jgi:hypothetical protein
MKFPKALLIPAVLFCGLSLTGCIETRYTADDIQRQQQEQMNKEATTQTGMPAITQFTERKNLKRILELRDRAKFVTYTYVLVPGTGERKLLCKSFGYGIPYATQYTNPQKIENPPNIPGQFVIPQADPNGLYSPASADATWVLCVNPAGGEPAVVYEENRITVSPFELPK